VRALHELTGTADRARALLARMPANAFISHLTALELHGFALPSTAAARGIDIAMPAGSRGPHATGIVGHQLQLREGDVELLHGLPVTRPARAWADIARRTGVPDLVAIGDQLVGRAPGAFDELAARAALAPRHLGAARMRRAVSLLDGASESYPESLLRVAIVQAGFAAPAVNQSIRLAGRTLRPDLSYSRQRVIIEYQGDYHREPQQWRADLHRRLLLESAGWTVIEATWEDLSDPGSLFARLRALGIPG